MYDSTSYWGRGGYKNTSLYVLMYFMWPWILINGSQQLMETLGANALCPAHYVPCILWGVNSKDLHEAAGGDKKQWMWPWLRSSCSSGGSDTWSATWHNGKSLYGATTMMTANLSQNNPVKPWPTQYLALSPKSWMVQLWWIDFTSVCECVCAYVCVYVCVLVFVCQSTSREAMLWTWTRCKDLSANETHFCVCVCLCECSNSKHCQLEISAAGL